MSNSPFLQGPFLHFMEKYTLTDPSLTMAHFPGPPTKRVGTTSVGAETTNDCKDWVKHASASRGEFQLFVFNKTEGDPVELQTNGALEISAYIRSL